MSSLLKSLLENQPEKKQSHSDWDDLFSRAKSGQPEPKPAPKIEPKPKLEQPAAPPKSKPTIERPRVTAVAPAQAPASNTNVAIRQNAVPAVMPTGVAKIGNVSPKWTMVKDLPGYLADSIKNIGTQVFQSFTNTPIEDIQVLANLMNNGPNSEDQLNAVTQYLTQNGEPDREAELDFRDSIPGYTAKIKVYNALGYTFLLVKDFAGQYIYGWPSSGNKLPPGKAEIGVERKRLT